MSKHRPVLKCALKSYRLRHGLSQEDVARAADIRRQAVYDMESGKYLPNTAVALRLARLFDCSVEDLFAEEMTNGEREVRIMGDIPENGARLALARVRDTLVALPVDAARTFCLRPADGFVARPGGRADIFTPHEVLDRTVLVLGCDPALDVLADHAPRALPTASVRCLFASSGQALSILRRGGAHMAATHFHDAGSDQANVAAARNALPGTACRVLGFSRMEEGLMVAPGNPLSLRNAEDVLRPGLRFAIREQGAAVRRLFEKHLAKAGIGADKIAGTALEVRSHGEGAYHVACGVTDAALGLRVVAEAFGLSFIPLAVTRCDLILPVDLESHPVLAALLDAVNSSRVRKAIASLPGHDSSVTGKEIALVS